jgi:hypothetical protein
VRQRRYVRPAALLALGSAPVGGGWRSRSGRKALKLGGKRFRFFFEDFLKAIDTPGRLRPCELRVPPPPRRFHVCDCLCVYWIGVWCYRLLPLGRNRCGSFPRRSMGCRHGGGVSLFRLVPVEASERNPYACSDSAPRSRSRRWPIITPGLRDDFSPRSWFLGSRADRPVWHIGC